MLKRLLLVHLLMMVTLAQAHDNALTIYTEQHPPLSFTAENGELTGFAVEVVQAIQKRIDSHDKIEFIPWARGY